MGPALAKTYVVLSGAILFVVGVAGFFRYEMFNLTFPPAHNVFHLVSGLIALVAGLGKSANGVRLFGLIFGAIYLTIAVAGFAGLQDLGPMRMGLNMHYNFIHLGVGLLSLAAGFASIKTA
ncbi:MAG TPA: DUF4383 domain-containing protein [Terriglobales bacterium]|nr:DUF4383 domain-containing protein [Terriglobales bacterium]